MPTGGADNMPTFVSLFSGNDLEIGILMDDNQSVEQQLESLTEETQLNEEAINTISEFAGNKGDIEDLFEVEFYLALINSTYREEIDSIFGSAIEDDYLGSNSDRIIKRLEKKFSGNDIGRDIGSGKFNHKLPAKHLVKNKEEFRDQLTDETKEQFADLFSQLNKIIETES